MRQIKTFAATDDCTHAAPDDPTWQESALFAWQDLGTGLGGFLRLSQEPANQAVNCCFGVFTEDGTRFRANATGEGMVAGDRGETHMAWGSKVHVALDTLTITADFPECQARLRFEDFHPRYDYIDLVRATMVDGTSHHFEVAGKVVGTVVIDGREIAVDALAYRDRSWGPRSWGSLRSTRWWPCVFGPDLSIHSVRAITASGHILTAGYVLRNGEPLAIEDCEILVTMETDAVTPRSGTVTMTLENGERLEITCDRADGIVLHVRGYTAVECLGRARFGDRVGMSNLEVCTNGAGGTLPPVLTIGSNNGQGLSRR